jgi:hypothetical protein
MTTMINFEVQIYGYNGQLVKFYMFNLLQLKHALALEIKTGMSLKGGKASTHLKKLLGCPRSYKKEDLLQHISDSIDNINKQLGVA